MAITYPITWPTAISPTDLMMRAVRVDAMSRSQFTGAQQVIRHQGQWWEADITMPPMSREEAEDFIAFALQLDGRLGTFTMTPPDAATPRGSASVTPGTPLVNGASQTGAELAIDGAPVSATGYLRAGDYIQLGAGQTSRLHKVTVDADTDGSGQVTLDIWPSLRTSPADDETVVVINAAGLFRLAQPDYSWTVDVANFYGMAFTAIEAL